MWYGHYMGWGWMVFGGVMMLLFWGGLFALVVWLVRSVSPERGKPSDSSTDAHLSAREILDRRYARGEITGEQYESMKADLAS